MAFIYLFFWYRFLHLLLEVRGDENTSVVSDDAGYPDVLVRVQNAGSHATKCNHHRRGSPANSNANSGRMRPRNIQSDSASYSVSHLGSIYLWNRGISGLGEGVRYRPKAISQLSPLVLLMISAYYDDNL